MAVAMIMKWAGVTPEQYEEVRRVANWEGDRPPGAQFHVAAFDDDGIRITDIWDSQEDFERFQRERLGAGTEAAGITGEPNVEFAPVHATFNPGIDRV